MIQISAIKFRTDDDGALAIAKELSAFFKAKGMDVLLLSEDGRGHPELEGFIVDENRFTSAPQLAVAIGGDGTFLRTARIFAKRNIPIMGINRGRLGFLTEFNPDEYMKYLPGILNGDFSYSQRAMFSAAVLRNGQNEKEEKNFDFINDAVISRGSFSRSIEFVLELDGVFLNRYSGDGLIVSTATGSTAYSLSAGGPILAPQLNDVFLLTPVCPHALGIRSMALPSSSVLKARAESGYGNLLLTIDGQEAIEIGETDEVLFRASGHKINLITHPEKNFYTILREKLSWGK